MGVIFFVLHDQNLSEKGRNRKTDDEVVGLMGQGVGWLSGGGKLTGDRGSVGGVYQFWGTTRVQHYILGVWIVQWFGCKTPLMCLKHHD